MKYKLIQIVTWPLRAMFKLSFPFMKIWNRLYQVALLNAKTTNQEYSIQCDGKVHIVGTGNIKLGKHVRLGKETEFETMEEGIIEIGNDVRINRGCLLASHSNISIGDYSMLGEYVSIRDANHGMKYGQPMRFQEHNSDPIVIGKDVWIGRGACILPGVTIEEGAVIGANSVVNRNVPAYSIAAGVPCKIIMKRRGWGSLQS
jgi:acetyltransferase-like isoleucine patch superfamily enzyme